MPHLSIKARRRIVSLVSGGFTVPSIVQRLEEECRCVPMSVPYNSTHGYIQRVAIFHAWTYSTRGHIPRVHGYIPCVGLNETCMLHAIRKRGPRLSTQTRNGIHWVPRVITRVKTRGKVKL